jgi:dihydroorotate dehydrogenase/Fe-S-cluster-containing hydrogenase component 2
MVDLTTKLGPLSIKNPFIVGGGPLTGTADHIRKCIDAGFGALVTKTASTPWFLRRYPRPLYKLVDYRENHSNSHYIPDDYTWMHREHNSVYHPLKFAKIIEQVADYAREKDCAIIGSFAARWMEEWEGIAIAYEKAGCTALELNFCCPFPPEGLTKNPEEAHIGIHFTRNPEEGAKVLRRLRNVVKIPMFAKLSPDGGDFGRMTKVFAEAGAAGVTMFANNKNLRVDIETGKPILYGPTAATGPWAKAQTLRWLAEIAPNTGEMGIMGGRGASTWEDAVEFLMCGASAIQYCSSIIIRGVQSVRGLIAGLTEYMERRGYKDIARIQGAALKHIYKNQDLIDKVKALYAEVDLHKCVGCSRCTEVCCFDAIKFFRKAIIKKENCAGCSLCSQVCASHAIQMHERDNDEDHFRAMFSGHPELAPKDFFDMEEENYFPMPAHGASLEASASQPAESEASSCGQCTNAND